MFLFYMIRVVYIYDNTRRSMAKNSSMVKTNNCTQGKYFIEAERLYQRKYAGRGWKTAEKSSWNVYLHVYSYAIKISWHKANSLRLTRNIFQLILRSVSSGMVVIYLITKGKQVRWSQIAKI